MSVSLTLTPFARTEWWTQIFGDRNRFNKGGINEAPVEWTLQRIQE